MMEFSLAYIKNNQQFMLKSYTSAQEVAKASHLNIEELKNKTVQAIFVPSNLAENEEIIANLNTESNHSPLRPIDTNTLNADQFDNMNSEEALKLFSATHSSWVLKNNLHLLENLADTVKHLKTLWPNDRTTFFEEIWYLLKKNLGAHELTIAYNHMLKAQKDGEKNKLVRVVVEGAKTPNPTENKELGEALFKNYEGKFNATVEKYEQSENQVVYLATINDSPIIIMAKIYDHGQSRLLNSLFKAFFDLLQK